MDEIKLLRYANFADDPVSLLGDIDASLQVNDPPSPLVPTIPVPYVYLPRYLSYLRVLNYDPEEGVYRAEG